MLHKLHDMQWARRFGFVPQKLEDPVSWIQTQVANGKIIGQWSGNFQIYLNPSHHAKRLSSWLPREVSLGPVTDLPMIQSRWDAIDCFSEGYLDYFVCGDWYLKFPEVGNSLLGMLSENQKTNASVQPEEQSGPLPTLTFDISGDPFLTNLWGKILAFHGDFSGAGKAFREAIELIPEFSEPYSNLGTLLWNLGQRQEAFMLFTQAFVNNPHRVAGQLNFFDAGYELEEFSQMASILEEIMSTYPEFVEWHHHLAICYHRMDRTPEAVILLEDIIKNEPSDNDARTLLEALQNNAEKSHDSSATNTTG